jgi:hypothetical protein
MKRGIPSVLWVGIAVLGVMTLITLLVGVQTGSDVLLAATIPDTALLAGLMLGHKWAYVGLLLFAIGTPLAVLGRNPEQTILDLLPLREVGWLLGLVHLGLHCAMMWFLLGGIMDYATARNRPELAEQASTRRMAYILLICAVTFLGFTARGLGAEAVSLAVIILVSGGSAHHDPAPDLPGQNGACRMKRRIDMTCLQPVAVIGRASLQRSLRVLRKGAIG